MEGWCSFGLWVDCFRIHALRFRVYRVYRVHGVYRVFGVWGLGFRVLGFRVYLDPKSM